MKKKTIEKEKPVEPSNVFRLFKEPYTVYRCLIIVVAGMLAYSNSFFCSFQLDDFHAIVYNKVIMELDMAKLWNYSYNRFLPYLSFALNYSIHEFDVFGYHLFNFIVHICNALVILFLVQSVFSTPQVRSHSLYVYGPEIAFFTALIFAVHPLSTQAVTYVVQRMASMAALFYFATVFFYLKWRLSKWKYKGTFLLACVLSGIGAFLTKQNSYTLPIAILLTELFLFKNISEVFDYRKGRVWLGLTAVFVFVILVLVLNKNLIHDSPPAYTNDYKKITPQNYLFTQFTVIPKYFQLLLVPVNQNIDYHWPLYESFSNGRVILGFLLMLGTIALACFLYNKNRLFSYGILFFLVSIFIESSFIPLDDLIVEHRTYLPSLGYFLLFVSLLYVAMRARYYKILFSFMFCLIVLYASACFQRNIVWKTEVSLWKDAIKKSPGKARPYNSLGGAYYRKEMYDQAIVAYSRAIEMKPQFYEAYINRAHSYMAIDKPGPAANDFKMGIKLVPSKLDNYISLLPELLKDAKYDEVVYYSDYVLSKDPDDAKTFYIRGKAFLNLGKNENALVDFNQSARLDSSDKNLFLDRGLMFQSAGQFEKAIADYNIALNLDSAYTEAFINRGITFKSMNRFEDALKDFGQIIKYNPDFEKTYLNRAGVYMVQKKWDLALRDLDKAILLKPDYSLAFNLRGYIHYMLKDNESACLDYQRAAALGNKDAEKFITLVCK